MATQSAGNATVDRHFEEIVSQSQNFEHYEKIFQESILDIESDDALETFRTEYESLHTSFLKCHEGEKRLIKKCQDLSAEIASCILKVRAADELSQGDQNTIEQLRREIEKAKTKISQSKETEVTLKERIKQHKLDIKELDAQLKKGPASVVGQDSSLAELANVKANLQKEHDTQRANLLAIQHDIAFLQGRVRKVREEKAQQDNELAAIRTGIELKEQELEEQHKRRDQKDKELKVAKENLTLNSRSFADEQAKYATLTAEIKQREEQVAASREELDNVVKQLAQLRKQSEINSRDNDDMTAKNKQTEKEIETLTARLRAKNSEVAAVRADQVKQSKLCDAIDKRNTVLETQLREAQSERDALHDQLTQMEMAISSLTKQSENDKKQLEDLTRERDILNKNYLKAQSATQRQQDWLMVKENQRRNLDHQLRGYERHAQKQREIIAQLAKEAKAYEEEAETAAHDYLKALDEVRKQEQAIIDKQKEIQDRETKLREQQQNLDKVTKERNLYAEQALKLQQEINEMTRKFKGMQTQINSLKKQISVKESELKMKDEQVSKLISDMNQYNNEIDSFKKVTEKRERTIEKYNDELHKLNQIIAEAGTEKAKQRRDHVNVLNERDILGAQLIRRNDELAKLYEQIRIQQSTLRKGEAQYSDRLRDINNLSFRVQQLRTELTGMRAFASRLPDLKLLLNKATQELNKEQCRVRALLDECDNPRNVHRYRRLEGSEPQTQLLFERVRELQEELLSKSSEVEEKDRLIAEKEKLYVELKAIIARQPGPEVAEQLNVYQDSLQKKSAQLRNMKDSLKHFQEQVDHYKARYDELRDELRDLSSEYVQSRKHEAKATADQRRLNEMLGRPLDAPPDPVEEVYTGYTAPPRPASSGPGADGADGVVPLGNAYAHRPPSEQSEGTTAAAPTAPTRQTPDVAREAYDQPQLQDDAAAATAPTATADDENGVYAEGDDIAPPPPL